MNVRRALVVSALALSLSGCTWQQWVNRTTTTVRVDGIVTAVCDKAGCWMDLRDEKANADAQAERGGHQGGADVHGWSY